MSIGIYSLLKIKIKIPESKFIYKTKIFLFYFFLKQNFYFHDLINDRLDIISEINKMKKLNANIKIITVLSYLYVFNFD